MVVTKQALNSSFKNFDLFISRPNLASKYSCFALSFKPCNNESMLYKKGNT